MYKIIMEDENFHLTPPPGHEFTRPAEINPPPKKKFWLRLSVVQTIYLKNCMYKTEERSANPI